MATPLTSERFARPGVGPEAVAWVATTLPAAHDPGQQPTSLIDTHHHPQAPPLDRVLVFRHLVI